MSLAVGQIGLSECPAKIKKFYSPLALSSCSQNQFFSLKICYCNARNFTVGIDKTCLLLLLPSKVVGSHL